MKKLMVFLFFYSPLSLKAQDSLSNSLAIFNLQNADSIFQKNDTVVHSLWYPEQGIFSLLYSPRIGNIFLNIKDSNIYLLSKIDSYQLKRDRKLNKILKIKLDKWCLKKRTRKQFQKIIEYPWEDSGLVLIPEYRFSMQDKPFYFKTLNNQPLSNKVIRKILIIFGDD